MLKNLIEKEIRENISSTKFSITFGICSMLIILAFYIGAQNYKIADTRYNAAKSENLRQLEGLTDWLSVRDFRIFLPPNPLETLVSGVSNDIGRTIQVDGKSELAAEDSRYGNEPIYAVFRFLDLEFIFQIVLSLFAVLFAYDSINGEKEKGTLKLAFANPLPRDVYLVSKILGSIISLLIPLLIPFLIGLLILPALNVTFTTDEWLRLTLTIVSGFVYVASFLILSVFISCTTWQSSNSFLILLAFWIFAVMIIPRISVIVSGWIVDVPEIDKVNTMKSRYMSQLFNEDKKAISSFKPTRSNNPEEMMKEFNKFMQELHDNREEKFKEFATRLNEDHTNKENQMINIALMFARISPASVFSLTINKLAGTSLKLQKDYYKAASDYQIQFNNFIQTKTGISPGGMIRFRVESDTGEKPRPINPRELPEFNFKKPGINNILSEFLPDIALLLLFNLIFFSGAYISFRNYDLR